MKKKKKSIKAQHTLMQYTLKCAFWCKQALKLNAQNSKPQDSGNLAALVVLLLDSSND